MLLFQPMCGYYGDFTRAFKGANKYTQGAEQMNKRKAQKNSRVSSKMSKKRRSSLIIKPPLGFLNNFEKKKKSICMSNFMWKKSNSGCDEWSPLYQVFTSGTLLYVWIQAYINYSNNILHVNSTFQGTQGRQCIVLCGAFFRTVYQVVFLFNGHNLMFIICKLK